MALLKPVTSSSAKNWGPTAKLYEPAGYGYLGRFWWNWQPAPFRYYAHFHPGTDLGAPEGTPIYASEAGTVVAAGWNGPSGLRYNIRIRTNPTVIYVGGHCKDLLIYPGQRVSRGQLIGHVGHTGVAYGSHVHFGVQIGSMVYDPNLFFAGGANANDWRIRPV